MKLPPYDLQYCAQTGVDSMNCIEESLCNLIYMQTGFHASPRALANMAYVDLNGSTTQEAIDAACQKYEGLIPNALWPTPQGAWTWKDYYCPIPQSILEQYIPVKIELIAPDPNLPIWTTIQFPNGVGHGVVRPPASMGLPANCYVDSEPGGQIKIFGAKGDVIKWASSVKITPIGDFFPKSSGFGGIHSPLFLSFSPEVQQAIIQNDNGGQNVIMNGKIIPNP